MDRLTESQQLIYAAEVPGLLENMANVHVQASGGAMVLLPHAPSPERPGQEPLSFIVEGNPQSIEATDYAANVAEKRYIPVRDALRERAGTFEVVKEAGEHLDAGGNIAVITRHDNLIDIAYALKMAKDLLHYQQYGPDATAIVIGKMLSRIGHLFTFEGEPQEVPAIMTLQLLCSHIYMSHPRTKSTKQEIDKLSEEKAEIVKAGIGLHNEKMTGALIRQLENGGVLLGLAPTGTTRKESVELTDRTIGLMKHPKMRILSMLVEYEGEAPFAYLYPDLLNITNDTEAREAVNVLLRAETKGVKDASDAELIRRFGGVALG